MLGLTMEQLLILAGVAVALVILLFLLRAFLRLTRVVVRFGCLGIVVILVIVFALMRLLGA